MRELVDHAHLRLARKDGVDVHLFELDALVRGSSGGDDLEIADLRLGVGAAVGFDEADDDVDAARLQRARVLEHRVGLADTWRGADVDAQPRAVLLLEPLEQLLRRRAHGIGTRAIVHSDRARRPEPYGLFTAFSW